MVTYLDARELLNVSVSCFLNYNTPSNPEPINLYRWLTNTKYRDKVLAVRAERDKEKRDILKSVMPAITPHGEFTYRQAADLIRHSGFLQFDIDLKDNSLIRNYTDLKAQISKLPFVAFCGLSASGLGYWGLVPIAYPERHGQHFDALYRVFSHYRIKLDDKPRSVASLRGYSYDPDAYFAEKVMLFELYDEPQPFLVRHLNQIVDADTERQRVEVCIGEISRRSIDITSGYNNWYAIGCDIASTFGEGGRDYFHIVSQYHPEYQTAFCDRQYSHCLRKFREVSLRTFFSRCRDSGISWKGLLPYEQTKPIEISPNALDLLPSKTGKSANSPIGLADELIGLRIEDSVSSCETSKTKVSSIAEQVANPGSILKPNESQLERLTVEVCEHYPPDWDEPNPPGKKLKISAKSFHEWQQQNPYFSQMGLPSIQSK